MTFARPAAPNMRTKRTTKGIMYELTAAILVLYICAVVYYYATAGVSYGNNALFIGLISVGMSVLCDAIIKGKWIITNGFPSKKNKDKALIKENWMKYLKGILHSYSYVSGLILALLLPVGTPLYVVVVSAFFATFVGKTVFGGFGNNIFNPAVVGRVFAQLCFGSQLVTFIGDKPADFTISTGASITSSLQGSGWLTTDYGISLTKMLFGEYRGTLGETFAIIILVIGIYLAVRKIIDWRIPVTYVVTIYVSTLVMGLCGGLGTSSFEFALRQILAGGVLFGAVFCLTDPVTSPTNPVGKVIFALGAALVTMVIRYMASAPEGVAYSILIMNMLTPAIALLLKGKTNEKMIVKYSIMGGLLVCNIIFGLAFGLNNKVNPVTIPSEAHVEENHTVLVVSNDQSTPVDIIIGGAR